MYEMNDAKSELVDIYIYSKCIYLILIIISYIRLVLVFFCIYI